MLSAERAPKGQGPHGGEPGPASGGPPDIDPGPRTVVVAGDDSGPPPRELAQSAGWPLLAEPTSGVRTGDHVIRTYRLLLETDLGRSDRARRRRRPPDALATGDPTARPRRRGGRSTPPRGVGAERPFAVDDELDLTVPLRDLARPPRDDPAWLAEWRAADAERRLAGSTRCWPRSPS